MATFAASLELCRTLFELSDWTGTDKWYVYTKYLQKNGSWEYGWQVWDWKSTEDPSMKEQIPAYDLGYLVRRLLGHGGVEIRYGDKICEARSQLRIASDDTPEDAVCKLIIELVKVGEFEQVSNEEGE